MSYILYSFIISCTIIYVCSDKLKDYGSFGLVVTKVELCKGPKRKDCSIYRVKLHNNVTINFDVQITENMSPVKGKVLAISKGKEFLRLQISKPCEHIFVKPIITSLFNITNNCIIKKGRYLFTINFEEVLRAYYGGMHFYGLYAFKALFYGDSCNLSCSVIEVMISGNSGKLN
ncbi:uncharacterized protein LOC124630046 [Helicoverpa zea]|uniref:uncharacterized protein LOC124630046 n=1 Tax=Helicoverpa zea TaxID=7113 RepID=UPI001F58352A|nr:uncharacterized protein LOC124630046 [Helicoverpa zea]